MSYAHELTDVPAYMHTSFNYLWESSPEKDIGDPLSYDLPDVTSDFEVIYDEGAAKLFFPQTPPTVGSPLPVLRDCSTHGDVFLDLFGPELTPKLPSQTESSPASSSGYASDPSLSSHTPPSPSPKQGVPGGKKGRQTTMSNARALYLPYRRHPRDSTTASPLSRLDYSSLPSNQASPCSSTSSSVSSNPDDVLTPEFMHSLQVPPPGTPMVDHLSLPENHGSGLPGSLRPVFRPHRPMKSQPPTPRSAVNEIEAFAHRYCRYDGCGRRFSDKRTTERHRLTHLGAGTFICPNPGCDSHKKVRPHFASDFSLGRHFRLAADGSPCAVGKGQKLSLFKMNVEAQIQQALDPFDPAIHTPF